MPVSPLRPVVAPALALTLLLGVPAVGILLAASPAIAGIGIAIGPAPIHADTTVTISGSKDADSTVTVAIKPPGHTWTTVDAHCVGLGPGADSWSCHVPAGSGWANGDHQVTATQSGGAGNAAASGRFVVVPPAVQGPHPAPVPPLPTPTPTTTPTSPPTSTPTTPPTPASGPTAPATVPTHPSVPSGKPATRPGTPPVQLTTLALPVTPDPGSITPPAQVATPRHLSSPPPSRNEPSTPSVWTNALPTFADLLGAPASFAAAGGFGAILLLLIAIPAHFLDDTVEANAHRIAGWFSRWAPVAARWRRLRSRLPRIPFSGPLLIVLASVAFGFADPQFGFDLVSLRTTLALAIGLLLVMEVPNLATSTLLRRRWSARARIVVQPGALFLSIAGVLASRLFGFHPGLLIGLVMGLELASDSRTEHRKRAVALRMGITAGIAAGAWLLYSLLNATGPEPHDFVGLLTRETLVAATDEGLTGLVVALIPVTFMEGKNLFETSKWLWAAIAVPVGFLFAMLVLPRAFSEEGPQTSFWVWIAVLIVFSALALAVWLAFRLTAHAEAEHEQHPEPVH
ncbi:MAG TPA: hypothetical protein VFQ74_06175 [Pseudolysinimonas sp.]|nr:hypothetical protein [Pseudolysinimonas sp.]